MTELEDSPGSPASFTEETSEKSPKPVSIPTRRTSFFGRILGRKSQSPVSRSSSAASGTRSRSSSSNYRESSTPPLTPLTLKGYRQNTKHKLLDSELAENIRNLLPARSQLYDDWDLVYSLEQHGISLKTLYRNCNPSYQLEQLKKNKAESGFGDSIVKNMVVGRSSTLDFEGKRRPSGYVIVIRDEKGSKFGCYLNEHPRPMDTKRYYGNGECFLWKCEDYNPGKLTHHKHGQKEDTDDLVDISDDKELNEKTEHEEHEEHEEKSRKKHKKVQVETRFKAFPYTGINSSVVYSNHNFLAVGSSDGHNGLWIDQALYKGVSCVCDTFGNEVLNESDPNIKVGKFKIMGLEVWRIGTLE